MLYRKAKFWVLGGGGIAGILFFMVVLTIVSIVEEGIPGEFLLEGTDAYLALYFFSYAQAIVIAFVAGDFRKSERNPPLPGQEIILPEQLRLGPHSPGGHLDGEFEQAVTQCLDRCLSVDDRPRVKVDDVRQPAKA